MPEAYIPLENAAILEDIDYEALKKRLQRHPKQYKTQPKPRADGGKDRVLVAVSSLSPRARRIYSRTNQTGEALGDEIAMDMVNNETLPWYAQVDCHWYIQNYPKQYEQGKQLAELMREFNDYCGEDRTGFSESFAAAHGMTQRTLYRNSQDYLTASSWALRYERTTGRSHDHFKVLSLCRKPKESLNSFPSLDPEVKALVENIWFNKAFRANNGTRQMLYTKLVDKCADSGVPLPSYQTIARYISYLMERQGGSSAEYLARRGLKDWKNQFMYKGVRDTAALPVMEIVVGDVHTLDFWVQVIAANGKAKAIRPKVIAWMDIRSRDFWSYSLCVEVSTQEQKSCFAKGVRQHGSPKDLLIDNGKDFANNETLGHDRNDRLADDPEMKGFYSAMGVQQVYRSLPFQPWDKPIERVFETVINTFSKWFDSYTGTLTGSRTDAKVKKDIDGMLRQGKLFTLEEVYTMFDKWVKEVYRQNKHRGLIDSGDEFHTPADCFENADNRYYKAPPPDSYIAMLMMKAKTASVRPTGIRFNKQLYACESLCQHFNSKVNIRYMPGDDSRIFAFTLQGEYIGEIPLAEKLAPGFYADEEQLVAHKEKQNRQLRDTRQRLNELNTPFAQRPEGENATPRIVGGVELTLSRPPQNNVVTLPDDTRFSSQTRKRKQNDFYDKVGADALAELTKLG